jgi:hypothetical protein
MNKKKKKSHKHSKGKIRKSPPNYHRFSGWHPKLPKLGFRPPKLPDTCILAPSVSFGRLTRRKPSHVTHFSKKPEFTPLPTDWNSERALLSCLFFPIFLQYRRGEEVAWVRAQIHRRSQIELAVAASDRTRLSFICWLEFMEVNLVALQSFWKRYTTFS